MTAFIAAAYADRVELLTDGAVVRNDGTIAHLTFKPWISDSLPIAFAGRGNIGALMHVGLQLQRHAECGTVDGTIEAFEAALASGLPRLRSALIDGVLCAFSKTAGSQIYYFTTSDSVAGFDPFELYDVAPMYGAGSEPPAEELAALDLPSRMMTEPMSAFGVDIMALMRRHKMAHQSAGGHRVYGIGGHVDMVTVTPEGCTTRRLHEWPDDVPGKAIRPA